MNNKKENETIKHQGNKFHFDIDTFYKYFMLKMLIFDKKIAKKIELTSINKEKNLLIHFKFQNCKSKLLKNLLLLVMKNTNVRSVSCKHQIISFIDFESKSSK